MSYLNSARRLNWCVHKFYQICSITLVFSFQTISCGNDTGSSSTSEPQVVDCDFVSKLDDSVQHFVVIDFGGQDRPGATSGTVAEQDCLIALHGHGSDRWQFVKQTRDEVQATKDFARRHAMLYISPDYRAPTSWMGPKAESDLVQIIESIRSKYKPKRIFLCGGSMGGTSALTFAALHPELISGVASMNGTANHLEYENFQDAIAESFGGTKQEKPEEYKKRSGEYWPEKLTMPIGMTIDLGDTVVPPESCKRLANILGKLNRPVLLIERPDGGHDTNYQDATEILEFMLRAQSATQQ